MAHDVFISYAHDDKPTGDAVCATLEARGIRCWIAPRDVLPGSIYSASIVEAIHASRVFVLVFSSRANTSPHVMRELERAVNAGIPVLPLRIEDVPLSSSMEYFISTPHWLDALTPPLKKHLGHLADTVKLLLAKADADAAAAQPAPPAAIVQATTPDAASPTIAPPGPPLTDHPGAAEAPEAEPRLFGPRAATPPAVHRRPVGGALETIGGADRRLVVRVAAIVGGIGALLVIGYVAATSLNGGGQSAAAPTATASTGTPAPSPGASATPILSPSPTAAPSPTALGASWTATADMAAGRLHHTATLLADGRVLVAGGTPGEENDREKDPLASAELYDPKTGTWSATGSMATPRKDHAATLLDNGMVLVAGGVRSEGPFTPLASAELYDPQTGRWKATGAMHSKRGRPTVTLLTDGEVLVVGGATGEARYDSELYDPSTGKWRAAGALPGTHGDDHTATLLADGRVLVAGGSDPQGSLVAAADIYDPRTGKWTATGKMTTKRGAHTATLLRDGTVLVAGGRRTEEDPPLASAEIFDPKTGKWSATADLTIRRVDATATLLGDGRVLVAGGHSGADILAASEIYDPSTSRWGIGLRMTARSMGHTATLLADGRKVLVAGGGQGDPFAYRDAEIFDPGFGT